MKYVNKLTVVPFLLGMGATVLGAKALKSEAAHKAAVSTVAKALILRDEAAEMASRVREEAEDIYAEAKEQKQLESAKTLVAEAEAVAPEAE